MNVPEGSEAEFGLPPGSFDEKELTLAFQRGEKGAYQAIHDRYSDRVHGVCRRMLGNRDDAEEAAQETFLRTYQALGRFNGRYQMGAWITRIATNVSLDYLRTRARKTAGDRPLDDVEEVEPLATMEEDDPAAVCVRNSESRHVRRMLASLPPTHRAAIVLRDFEGLSYDEIAVALQMTSPQVKALIHRARQSFKRSWLAARLSALVPGFLHRVRRIEDPAREQLTRSSSTGQLAEVAASSASLVNSCSALLQSCGQFMVDKIVPALAGGALVAGAMVTTGQTSERTRAPEEVAIVWGAERVFEAMSSPARSKKTLGEDDEETTGEAPPAEPAEQPVAQPTPQPATTPPPGTEDGSGGTATPPPLPPEPTGFTLSFATDLASDAPACTCVSPTAVRSHSHHISGGQLVSLSESLTGGAAAVDRVIYGLEVNHRVSGEDHVGELVLISPEGSYRYTATGRLLERRSTEWGGMTAIYTGTYKLSSRPTSPERLPDHGSYRVEITTSARSDRVVSVSFFLIEGPA